MSEQQTPPRTDDTQQGDVAGEMDQQELDAQQGEELPDREAMSLVNANLAAPVNAAVALNALSDNSTAIAVADQTAPIKQKI
jgi:hypothetical protein